MVVVVVLLLVVVSRGRDGGRGGGILRVSLFWSCHVLFTFGSTGICFLYSSGLFVLFILESLYRRGVYRIGRHHVLLFFFSLFLSFFLFFFFLHFKPN